MAERIAVVHDWLDTWRGGENVLAEVLRVFPSATLFSLVDFLPDGPRQRIGGRRAKTSFLQHLPGARRNFRSLLPLMPLAVGRLDVDGYDLVVSVSHAFAKGVRTRPGQLHVCVCLTPIRYAWDLREQYLAVTGLGRGLRGAALRRVLDAIARWDRRTSTRVTRFVAISEHVRSRIARCYGRDADVVHPPVDVAFFEAERKPGRRENFFVAGSRFVPYKRLDLVAAAFRSLPDRRLVIFGDGPEAARVRAAAGVNVEFVGETTRERLRELLTTARAFVFAADEDFGILPLEAQACGTPVIAYGRGGATETVRPLGGSHPTGLLFAEQSAQSVAEAVRNFESAEAQFDPADAIANARRLAPEHFRRGLAEAVARARTQQASRLASAEQWPAAS